MQGIENSNRAHPAQNNPSENSRRPGTAGHPGKHLGQFKKAGIQPDAANKPLIAQQLSAMQGEAKGSAAAKGGTSAATKDDNATNAQTEQQDEASIARITAEHMNDMSDTFADQISFTSKIQAINTGLF